VKRNNTVPFCAINPIDSQTVEMVLNGYIVPPDWADGDLYHSAQTFIDEFKKIDGKYKVINIHLGALYGGSVYEGNVIFNALENSKSEINTHVTGLAASMGYQLFLAGKKRTMNQTAQIMAHKAWTFMIGNADDLRAEAVIMDKIDNNIKLVTKQRSNLSDEQIDEIFSKDTFFTADEAKEAGLATDVIPLKSANEALDNNVKDMKNLLTGGVLAGLLNFNLQNSNKPNNSMTEEQKIADAVAKARQEEKAAHQAALDAKDAEIADLKKEAKKEANPPKEENADLAATLASLQKTIDTLNAKVTNLEKSTEKEPPIDKQDNAGGGAKEEESFSTSYVNKLRGK
jgi:ATP-dependent Clp protease protease subunit